MLFDKKELKCARENEVTQKLNTVLFSMRNDRVCRHQQDETLSRSETPQTDIRLAMTEFKAALPRAA